MDRPKLWRVLRITWTTGCAVVCLLLIVLWVRSYWRVNSWQGYIGNKHAVHLQSARGKLYIFRVTGLRGIQHNTFSNLPIDAVSRDLPTFIVSGDFYNPIVQRGFSGPNITLPYWCPFAIFAAMGFVAAFPWLPTHFSLRTLLIAVTLLAVLLGLVVWAVG